MTAPPTRRPQAKPTGLNRIAFALAAGLIWALLANGIAPGLALAQGKATKTASPPAMQTLVEPLWADLTPDQRSVLEPFGAQWNTWSAQEKRVWVSLANKWPQYTPVQQARAKQRIKDWAALSPEQRRLARSNYRLANKLPKSELVDQTKRYEGMTPEQRTVLRENGSTSNTAAKYGGARTGLAKDAAKPLAGSPPSSVARTGGSSPPVTTLKP